MKHHPHLRILLALLLSLSAASAAPPFIEKLDLFESGKDDYALYRIPGVVVAKKGAVLAWCEARKTGKGDWGLIDIMMRRSNDGGRTWLPRQCIVHVEGDLPVNPVAAAQNLDKPGDNTANNPVAITDRETGEVHFLYCLEYMRCFYMRSDDEGATWSKPVEITATFEEFRSRRGNEADSSNQPASSRRRLQDDYYDWKVIATGPDHGIQLTHGPHKGRLVVPIWMSLGTGNHAHRPSVTSTIYSDDHGKTWQRGEIAIPDKPPYRYPNETVVVQLVNGNVLLNARSESDAHRRIQTNSKDGATGWTKPGFNEQLLEPICMGSIVRFSRKPDNDKNRILFANPHNLQRADGKAKEGVSRDRRNLSIKLSYDECKTWPVNKVIEPGYSAYSDLAVLADGTILCFYERGREADAERKKPTSYAYLTLARFNLEWLTDGKDVPALDQRTNYGSKRDNFEIAGCEAFVIHPFEPAPGGAKPWVWYAPTIGHHPSSGNAWLLSKLLTNGFYVAGIYVGETFANPQSREQFAAFYRHVTTTYGLAPKVCLLAQSRGGLNHVNFAADHPDWVQCIAGIYTVGDLRSYPGLKRAAPMYGLSEAELDAQLPRHNPIERLAPIARAKIPILHIHGDTDLTVPIEKNSQVICDRYRALGRPMELVIVPGQGHNFHTAFFESEAMLAFLLKHGLGDARR
ncbi:MAG: exo-alpha-sialidase [Verrucomicrobia bacterium]|nr:exo-alpha-sialidase [Verrucomicrobiota bacterium]